jgi:tetratricopeptide (TPR) repeat protein
MSRAKRMSEPPDEISRISILLEGSRARRFDSPRDMVHLAELARAAAEALDPQEHGAVQVADLRARVWTELGNAYRVADTLDLADRALLRAVDCYEEGSGDQRILALIADRTASLLWHQRRFEDAFALLDRIALYYRSQGENSHAARTLISKGLFTESSGHPEEALCLLLEALTLLDSRADSGLRLAGVHNLLWCATELGLFPLIQRLLAKVRPLYGSNGNRLNLLRLLWIEGRVSAGLDSPEEAEAAFQEVRAGFLDAGLLFPASMVSLDLARLWLTRNRIAEIKGLAEELIESFRLLRVGREAIVSLLLLRRACEKERIVASEIAEAVERAATQIGRLSQG